MTSDRGYQSRGAGGPPVLKPPNSPPPLRIWEYTGPPTTEELRLDVTQTLGACNPFPETLYHACVELFGACGLVYRDMRRVYAWRGKVAGDGAFIVCETPLFPRRPAEVVVRGAEGIELRVPYLDYEGEPTETLAIRKAVTLYRRLARDLNRLGLAGPVAE